MKKFSKTLLSVAAVTAVSAAMAASAMAMEASYADGTLTLTGVNATGASQTILVLNEQGNTEGVTTENANEVVKQIDQKDDSTVFATVPVGTLTDGTYYVRIGGTDGSMQTAEFTVGGGGTEPETMDLVIGDVDLNGRVMVSDASYVAQKLANISSSKNENVGAEYKVVSGIDAETVTVGDVDLNGRVMVSDASYVAQKLANISSSKNENVSKTIKVEKK